MLFACHPCEPCSCCVHVVLRGALFEVHAAAFTVSGETAKVGIKTGVLRLTNAVLWYQEYQAQTHFLFSFEVCLHVCARVGLQHSPLILTFLLGEAEALGESQVWNHWHARVAWLDLCRVAQSLVQALHIEPIYPGPHEVLSIKLGALLHQDILHLLHCLFG